MQPSRILSDLCQLPVVELVCRLAQQAGGQAYLVGGAVRDALINGVLSDDLDFTVLSVSAEALAQTLAKALDGRWVPLDPQRGIHRVVVFESPERAACTVDLSDALGNDLSQDLARRDFTINAMALEVVAGTVIDPFEGQADAQAHRIQMVSQANLLEDPLRLLRGYRFLAQLPGFSLQPETATVLVAHRDHLNRVAAERIQLEWLKLLGAPQAAPVIQQMADTGWLETLIPELTACRQVPPNSHHHLPLWQHNLELLHQLELIGDTLPPSVQELLLAPLGASNILAHVRLGCLLHDIAKPATWEIDETGRHRFHGHEAAGEAMVGPILSRWRMSHESVALVKHLVRWHLYPCQFGPESPRKSILRFYRRMGEWTPLVVVVALVDRLATQGPAITPDILTKSVTNHHWLLQDYQQTRETTLTLPALLNGRDVMARFPDRKPGGWIRVLLEQAIEAQQLGQLTTREQALVWLLQIDDSFAKDSAI